MCFFVFCFIGFWPVLAHQIFVRPLKIVALIVKISSGNFVECTGKWTADVRLGIRGKDVIPAKMKDDVKFPS